jgi:hypothetical protein
MKILVPDSDRADVWNSYLRGGYATWQPGQDCALHSHQDAAEVFVILAVMPNHEPTHTFYRDDGTTYDRNRARPDRPDD